MTRPIVIVESPFAGDVERNTAYARAAMRDCLQRGEAPFASHLLYTQPGVLRDDVPAERALGIEAGFAFRQHAARTVVYQDCGISAGMRQGIHHANELGQPVEYRSLPEWDTRPVLTPEDKHPENQGPIGGYRHQEIVVTRPVASCARCNGAGMLCGECGKPECSCAAAFYRAPPFPCECQESTT